MKLLITVFLIAAIVPFIGAQKKTEAECKKETPACKTASNVCVLLWDKSVTMSECRVKVDICTGRDYWDILHNGSCSSSYRRHHVDKSQESASNESA